MWSSGKPEDGIATLRQSLAEFAALLTEDPANAIVRNAGNQVRAHLALMLAENGAHDEAVELAKVNLRLPPGADANSNRGKERALVYQIVLDAALLGAGEFGTAERQLQDTLAHIPSANHDLLWCMYHLLAKAFDAEGKRRDAFTASDLALKMALDSPEEGMSNEVMRAIAARDYADAVAHWPGSSDKDRAAARRALDQYCSRLDYRHGILAVTLLGRMPELSQIQTIRKRLDSPGFGQN